MFNEQNEIGGDMRDDVRAELEREEGYEACPVAPETDESVEAYAEEYAERESLDSSDDADALASAGMGTDEDYGSFGGEDDWLDGSYEDA